MNKKTILIGVLILGMVFVSGCDVYSKTQEKYYYNLFTLSLDGSRYYNMEEPCLYCLRINDTHFECGNGCQGEFHPQENVTEEELKNYQAYDYRTKKFWFWS